MIDFLDSSETVVHLVHPKPVPWPAVFGPFAEFLDIPLMSYGEWLKRLEDSRKVLSESEVELMKKIPALKLLDFFRVNGQAQELGDNTEREHTQAEASEVSGAEGINMPLLAIDNACKASQTLANPNLSKLGVDDAKKWLIYWRML